MIKSKKIYKKQKTKQNLKISAELRKVMSSVSIHTVKKYI